MSKTPKKMTFLQTPKDLVSHLIPAVLSIIFFEIISIEIYLNLSLQSSIVSFFIWMLSQAIGGFFLGFLSDKFCRKKTLLATYLGGSILIPLLGYCKFSWGILCLIGLIFSPSPVARAALIDNFPHSSKVTLISTTYIAQFIPWCLYKFFYKQNYEYVFFWCTIGLIINTIITYWFFEDKKDATHRKNNSSTILLSSKEHKNKATYTLLALIPGQLVFFISDTFFERLSSNSGLFSALGIGSLIGVIVGVFYRQLPHLSVLTFCFGVGFLLSAVPLITNFLIPESNINLPYQLMLFSNLGGFYLPFVFDVILSSTSVHYRGTACGIIDLIISIASIVGVLIVMIFSPNELSILLMTSVLFLCAVLLQKKGETHVI